MILPILLIIFGIALFVYIDNVFAERKFEHETGMQKRQILAINGTMYFWNVLIKYVFCSLIGISLRFLQDRKAEPKPDWPFQLVAGIACSYLAYILYKYYKITFAPLELFIIGFGWMGAYIIKTADYVARNGVIIYLRKISEDFLAYTSKDKKK